jgi:anaerobic selenocysteine-containing dehydrogenase
MKTITTACPRNCYSTCTFDVQVENGSLRRILPNPANRATAGGACLKGLSYIERVHSPDRILYPLRRNPGTGQFDRISWDDALDTIASQLVRLREEYGPQSVLYYFGSGTKGLLNGAGDSFWSLYGGYTTTYGDLCWPAGLEATRLTLGENKHNAPWDIANAGVVVFWGKNASETNLHQMEFVDEALAGGARLVVVDPRRTETSAQADLLIQPRPGTDGALALAIAGLLIRENRIDHRFIEEHVYGFPEFAELVAAWTPERSSGVCDVPVNYIYRFAEVIGSGVPVTINAGFGMQRYTNSGQAMRAIIALLAITGNIGRPGAGWIFANLQSQIFDAVKDPIALYPPDEPDGVRRVSVSTARLGADMKTQTDPGLRALWVERGNPVTQNPDTHTVLEAIRALEFRVVVDQFLTDTAREADIVLPAKTMFEQTDVINAYWHPYIQLKKKAIDPPGEVKPETEVYRLLARRLGVPDDKINDAFPGPADEDVERFLEKKLEKVNGLTLERLREGPVITPGHQEVAFDDFVFATPSGRIELRSTEARERWGVEELPDYSDPEESSLTETGGDPRFPLHLITPNTKNRIHSQFNNLESIRAVSPEPFVQVHPDDAEHRGIKDGAPVRVYNGRGELRIRARLDWGIKRGCVAITNGWWITQGGTVNFCSRGRETDMGHGAAFHDNMVEIGKAP